MWIAMIEHICNRAASHVLLINALGCRDDSFSGRRFVFISGLNHWGTFRRDRLIIKNSLGLVYIYCFGWS